MQFVSPSSGRPWCLLIGVGAAARTLPAKSACLLVGQGRRAFPLGLEMEEGVGSHHSVGWGYGMF